MVRSIYWLLAVIAVLVMVYVWMLLDTNPVIDYVLSVMDGSLDDRDFVGWQQYTASHYSEAVYWDISISREFVVHNFSDGVMWVKYSRQSYKQNGDPSGPGSGKIYSKWTIHKENGSWKIVDIDEHP